MIHRRFDQLPADRIRFQVLDADTVTAIARCDTGSDVPMHQRPLLTVLGRHIERNRTGLADGDGLRHAQAQAMSRYIDRDGRFQPQTGRDENGLRQQFLAMEVSLVLCDGRVVGHVVGMGFAKAVILGILAYPRIEYTG
jgi:hypothetical protein